MNERSSLGSGHAAGGADKEGAAALYHIDGSFWDGGAGQPGNGGNDAFEASAACEDALAGAARTADADAAAGAARAADADAVVGAAAGGEIEAANAGGAGEADAVGEAGTAPEAPVEPVTAKAPAAPETAEAPKTVETPETAEAPETAETPETVETPETAETPETPETAETPETPETAETPEAPAAPVEPVTDEASESPETPAASAHAEPKRDAPRPAARNRTVAVRHLYTEDARRKGRKRKPPKRLLAAYFILGALAGVLLTAAIAMLSPGAAYQLLGMLPQRGDDAGGVVRMVEIMSVDAPYQEIYEKVAPCIVRVQIFESAAVGDSFEDYYEFSGIIVIDDGHIVTDGILFEDIFEDGQGDSIRIVATLPGGAEHDATLVGYDPGASVAVIKIEADGLPIAELGDSDEVKAGELVVAVGSAECLDDATWVTNGIVNGIYQTDGSDGAGGVQRHSLIQTNAAMSYSSIGGALVNARGQVIGVNSGGVSTEIGYAGLNFAIPINDARAAAERLVGPIKPDAANGTRGDRGEARANAGLGGSNAYCGIVVDPSYDTNYSRYSQHNPGIPKGAMVSRVEPLSGAFTGGVERGDIITKLAGTVVESAGGFEEALGALAPGQTVEIEVYRDGRRISIEVELSEGTRE